MKLAMAHDWKNPAFNVCLGPHGVHGMFSQHTANEGRGRWEQQTHEAPTPPKVVGRMFQALVRRAELLRVHGHPIPHGNGTCSGSAVGHFRIVSVGPAFPHPFISERLASKLGGRVLTAALRGGWRVRLGQAMAYGLCLLPTMSW
ncbi:hypothetical protein ACCO45_013719 [Purpureocillium lilacinum]|uniref:Uncharacterized protein n=1 Tax=Purpureocillium lilacinum TaxID=33203 RepID=A0ACC4D7D0_PURLI